MNIAFFGSPDDPLSHITKQALLDAGYELSDKADLAVVASYGKILSKKTLESFKYGALNIHPSLLPKYRGPSPIRTAIANGDTETGVTIMKLVEEMDAGPIIDQQSLIIDHDEMHSQLQKRLAEAGAKLLLKIIPDYVAGKIELKPQDESQATYTQMLTREDGKVDLQNDSPEVIYNKFRAYEGWPGVWFTHKGKRVKILDCKLTPEGTIELLQLQPEGKKAMDIKSFINGYGHIN